MELETIIKIIGAIAAIFGAGKIIYEITIGRKSRLREEYKFAKEFLEDLKNNPTLHPFVVEKGYYAIAGSTIFKAEVIAYILSLKNPVKCLNDYVLSKEYLQTIKTNGDIHLAFSKQYSWGWFRCLIKGIYFFLYIFCAVMAIIPIFLPKPLIFILTSTPAFGYWAVIVLNWYIRIDRGEKLVKHQQRHTQMILLPNSDP